jgi:hypothetical protein
MTRRWRENTVPGTGTVAAELGVLRDAGLDATVGSRNGGPHRPTPTAEQSLGPHPISAVAE